MKEVEFKVLRHAAKELLYSSGSPETRLQQSIPESKETRLRKSASSLLSGPAPKTSSGGFTWPSEESSDDEVEEEDAMAIKSETGTKFKGFRDLICPLCLSFLYKCTTTVCGHSFCERCLDEYIIFKKVQRLKVITNICRHAFFVKNK